MSTDLPKVLSNSLLFLLIYSVFLNISVKTRLIAISISSINYEMLNNLLYSILSISG